MPATGDHKAFPFDNLMFDLGLYWINIADQLSNAKVDGDQAT